MSKPVSALLLCSLSTCGLIAGCATSAPSASLFGAKSSGKPAAQQVSHSKSAGLPEPTNKAASNSPLSLSSVDESLLRGEQELERGNYQLAQSHFDAVLKQQPDHVKAHHRLGVLADKLKHFEQAEQHYLSALNGDPRNAALLSDLGYSYFMQGRYADSERYLLEARKLDPNYHTAIANLGLLYATTGRKQESIAMFRQIGDEAQVESIMQQVASGQFSPMQPQTDRSTENPFAGSASNILTTETSVQPATAVPPQEMNDATRDFVEQMRKAKEDLQRAEQQYAQSQPSRGPAAAQNAPQPSTVQTPPAWSSQGNQPAGTIQQPPPYNPQARAASPQIQPGPQGGYLPDSALSDAMASIDRRDHPTPSNSPISIGLPESANATPANPMEQASWASQPSANSAQVPVYTGSTPQPMPAMQNAYPTGQAYADSSQPSSGQRQGQQPVEPPSYWEQRSAPQSGNMTAQGSSSQNMGGARPANPPSAWKQQFATSAGQTLPAQPSAGQPQVQQGAWSGQASQPGTIQQLNGQGSPYDQQSVEQAYHTQQQGQSQEIALAGQTGGPQGATSQPNNTNWASNNGQPAGDNLYEQGRRQAAILGLNAGPGQVFPYIQQTQRLMPGTDSRINGSQYPSPARHMPTGLIPPNYSGMSQNPQQASAANNRAQQSPMQNGAAPSNYGTPSNAGYPQQQQHYYQNQPQQPAAGDPYQTTRTQQTDQLNGLVNQTWGQSPQSPPYGVTPQATMQHYQSATTFTPPPANVSTAPYSQRADASTAGQTQQAGYQASAPYGVPVPQENWGGPVNPEPYRRATAPSDYSQQMPVIQGRPSSSDAAANPAYAPPMIVPNPR